MQRYVRGRNGYVVAMGTLSQRVCCPNGYVVTKGVLKQRVCCNKGYVYIGNVQYEWDDVCISNDHLIILQNDEGYMNCIRNLPDWSVDTKLSVKLRIQFM